ncbi:hypothetical protein ACEPAI_4207 [Sanghuangporus weigelae]
MDVGPDRLFPQSPSRVPSKRDSSHFERVPFATASMLFRPLRIVASSSMRLFSANTRALHSLDSSLSSSDDSIDNPFGSEWPPNQLLKREKSQALQNTSSSGPSSSQTSCQLPSAEHQAKSGQIVADSTSKSKEVLKSSTSQLSSSLSSSTTIPQATSKHSKENAPVDPAPKVVLDPPIVFPLKTYSYKNHDPSPSCVYVRTEEEADKLVEGLTGAVGFDIEWKVIFRRGVNMRPAATVQLSDQRTILVIQISAMKAFPKKLKELLENTHVAKVGVNILNDGKKLARDYGVHAQGLIELGGLARQADADYVERYFRASEVIQKMACTIAVPNPKMRKPGVRINLATVTAMYTGCELPKGPVRTSDWEIQPLNVTQLDYAANDAHSALIIYDRLMSMAKTKNVTLTPTKYTSSVEPQYGILSRGEPKPPPPKMAPIFQAPALSSKTSSSSSASTFISTSGHSSADGAVSSMSTSSHSQTTSRKSVDLKGSYVSKSRLKPAPPISYATASDGDVEVLETRNCSSGSHVIAQKLVSVPIYTHETEVLSSDLVIRGRIGPRFKPRFKPSYNNFPRPNLGSVNTATSETRPIPTEDGSRSSSASNNPSPERSPRFKPNYNTTLSRPPSPMKPTPTVDHAPSSRSAAPPLQASYQPTSQRTQHIRAYNLWHVRQLPLGEICGILRSHDNPLKVSTVISYVVTALQTDPRLRFSRERLRALLTSESKSWLYYRDWFRTLNVTRHVNMDIGIGEHGSNQGQNLKN